MPFTKTNRVRWFLLAMIALVTAFALSDAGKSTPGGYRKWVKDPRAIREYFHSYPVRKLQLGAGGNDAQGWLNTDIEPKVDEIYLDATQQYPFPDQSFHYIFSEHVIEHVPWEAGIAMLRECYRVLAPGGKLRVVTPDLARFVKLLAGSIDADAQQFIAAKLRLHRWPETPVSRAYIFNRQVRDWGHQFLYDSATLRKSLELAGFKQIKEYRVEDKTDPVFREVERRTRNEGSDLWIVNRWEAMAFEAIR
jgi:predicted SAM-dependent methyltransferase